MVKQHRSVQRLILAGLIAIGVPACGDGGGGPSTSPGDAAERYIEGNAEGDVDKILSVIPPDSRATWEDILNRGDRAGARSTRDQGERIKSVEVIDEEINGDTGTVKLKCSQANGQEMGLEVAVIRIDGAWYVDVSLPSLPSTP